MDKKAFKSFLPRKSRILKRETKTPKVDSGFFVFIHIFAKLFSIDCETD